MRRWWNQSATHHVLYARGQKQSCVPFKKDNMCMVLCTTFLLECNKDCTPQDLAKAIMKWDKFQDFIYGKKNKNQVTAYNVNGTVLQLIASGIIDLKVKKVSNINKKGETEVRNRVICSLGVMGIGLAYMNNNAWKAIPNQYLCK